MEEWNGKKNSTLSIWAVFSLLERFIFFFFPLPYITCYHIRSESGLGV